MFGDHRRIAHAIAVQFLLASIVVFVGCGSEDSTNDAPQAKILSSQTPDGAAQPSGKKQVSSPAAVDEDNGGDFRVGNSRGGNSNEQAIFGGGKTDAKKTDSDPEVVFKTEFGSIKVRLNREKAPQTVDNFLLNYVEVGFYDGTILHTVQPGKLIAGGGYTADFQAKRAGAEILSEADNGLKNLPGTIAMARYPDSIDSATSQFWFNLGNNTSLDYNGAENAQSYGYCVFGRVIKGMDVLERIASVQVVPREKFPNTPAKPVVIESVRRVQPLGPIE